MFASAYYRRLGSIWTLRAATWRWSHGLYSANLGVGLAIGLVMLSALRNIYCLMCMSCLHYLTTFYNFVIKAFCASIAAEAGGTNPFSRKKSVW